MKLEYDEEAKKKRKFESITGLSIATFLLIFIFAKILLSAISVVLIIFYIIIFILWFIFWKYIIHINYRDLNDKKLKDIGMKVKANIIDTYVLKAKYGVMWKYNLVISYEDNKTIKINFLKNNQAFKILELLLNSYSIKENNNIPIDLYIYKNKFYVDLESVDLTKVKGYEKCMAVLNESNKI